jgi:hypothetical protein
MSKEKGVLMAGIKNGDMGEPMPVEQTRHTVAALIDSLEHYREQCGTAEEKNYFSRAQEAFEVGCMLAVKGFYQSH